MSKTELSVKRTAVYAVLLALCALLHLTGCASPVPESNLPEPFQPVTVYDDGVYRVVCTGLDAADNSNGSVDIILDLNVTNNSVDSIAISSVLGIRVSADGQPCELMNVPAEKTPLDGLLDAETSRQGSIMTQIPVEAKSFTVEMSVDHLNDTWIAFEISR